MTDARILAGAFVLADADGDGVKAQEILGRVSSGEVTTVEFIVALARLSGELLQMLAGDGWRDELNQALLALDMEEGEEG